MPSPTPISCTDSKENWSTSGAGYVYGSMYLVQPSTPDIEQAYMHTEICY